MRLAWLPLVVGVPAILWAGCSAFGGSDARGTGEPGPADAQADDAQDASPETDGSTPVLADAHVPIPGALVDDDFEVGMSCDGWSNVNMAIALPTAEGRTGARSCLLCANGIHTAMQKIVPVNGAGNYTALVWMKTPGDGGASGAFADLLGYVDGGSAVVGGYQTRSANDQWQLVEAVVVAPAGTYSMAYAIELEGTSGCLLIDDVSLTRD